MGDECICNVRLERGAVRHLRRQRGDLGIGCRICDLYLYPGVFLSNDPPWTQPQPKIAKPNAPGTHLRCGWQCGEPGVPSHAGA